ncbi:MAG: hypothetical protein HYX52_09215 [Chloroflexi bacterium]|nr:hypothetical protein [Chloroflexota bacterium]
MKLLLGTSSPAKIERLHTLLDGLPVDLMHPSDVGPEPDQDEGEDSLLENAAAKAVAWSRAYSVATIATDGGLVIPALAGTWNPVRSRRAAGPSASDAERAAYVLGLAAHLTGEDRTTYRVEAAALADEHGVLVGTWEAVSDPSPLADSYDPRAVPAGFYFPGILLFNRRRYGDLDAAERQATHSHWERLRGPLRQAVTALAAREPGQGSLATRPSAPSST